MPFTFSTCCHLLLISALAALTACATGKKADDPNSLRYSADIFTPVTFIEHVGEGPMKNYLAMNVHYPPAEDLRERLEKRLGFALQNRGEAHITVLSPVEYDGFFKDRFGISKINDIAREMKIQELSFEPVCIGRGAVRIATSSAEAAPTEDQTYFIVLKSPQILQLRQRLAEALRAVDKKTKFDADLFYPHLTLGFTKRDLHLEDGVVKDLKSCVHPLILSESHAP